MAKLHRKTDPKVALLAGVAVFKRCSPAELERIAELTTEISVDVGHRFCREGEPGDQAFVVLDGEAEVSVGGKVINSIGPGGFLGEMALLDGGNRLATVTALTPMQVLVLNRGEFSAVLHDSPAIAVALLEGVGQRMRELGAEGQLT